MANEEQLTILKQGVEVWNHWIRSNPNTEIDLFESDLSGANLSQAELVALNLEGSNLCKANLSHANLVSADFCGANLRETNLREANLVAADFIGADLRGADLAGANLKLANFRGADLRGASLWGANLFGAGLLKANLCGVNLMEASLIGTRIDGASISGSQVYGINIWDLMGEFEEQTDLIITPPAGSPLHMPDSSIITVDNIKVAQFIYLILNNVEIRDVINTLTSKSVLILGRFSIPERKKILDALRNKLREYNLLPIVFDFERPTDKDFTETIKTLAGISYFVIADVTNPKSSPLELQATVPDYQIPFVPIIQEGESPFAMMVDLQTKYPWVLPTRSYDSIETLMTALKPGIIDPAVEMRNKLRLVKAQEHPIESLRDYLDKTL